MGMRFTLNIQELNEIARRFERASPQARRAVAEEIKSDTEPFVPAQTKHLVNRVQTRGDTIIYPGPYARFLYFGKLMIDPKTGSSWARKGASKVVTGKDLDISKSVNSKAQSHWFEASKALNREKWLRVAERSMRHHF